MDELSKYLLTSKTHASLSPESLELMGKKAATAYLTDEVPLNDSIAKLAGDHSDITPEQIKRVAEFANTAVYLAMHDQSKTAGADSSYPQFELADAGRILQDLSDGARPTVVTKTDIDYARAAQTPKLASASLDSALAGLFKVASSEKDYSEESIADQVVSTKQTLLGLRDNLVDRYNQHHSLFKEATVEFYDHVKRHMLDGGSFAEVYAAGGATGIDDSTLRRLMEPVVGRLLVEKVASPKRIADSMADLEKIAHREVNTDHELVQSFSAMVMSGEELRDIQAALGAVDSELGEVQSFIKNAYFTKEAFAGLLSGMAKMAPKVGQAAMQGFKNSPIASTLGATQVAGGIKELAGKKPPVPPM